MAHWTESPPSRIDDILYSFFPDPALALREMARVVKPNGTVAVQVWASRESQAGFKPFYEVVARHAGPEAVELIGAYWSLGDLDRLTGLFDAAGLKISSTRTRTGAIRAPSIDQYVTTEIESTPLIERISNEVYRGIRADARVALQPLYGETGGFQMPSGQRRDEPQHMVSDWYRIPESRQTSGGIRLNTVVTVGSGRLRWVPTGSRVRTRVQRQPRPSG